MKKLTVLLGLTAILFSPLTLADAKADEFQALRNKS
jgi:hypothetical protein